MKKTIRYTIIALIALGLSSSHAKAGDEALAALGGFLAGVITGAVIEDHHDHDYDHGVRIRVGSHHDDWYRHGNRHYGKTRCHKHNRYECNACRSGHHRDRGHWEVRHVKIWVPGHWEFVRNRCGDHVRVWKSGYYRTKPEKVWIEHRHGKRHGSYCD